MRISAKGRYALAAVVEIARSFGSGENIALIHVAERLGISKIYLEQAFMQLKKGDMLISAKGARGGYQLARAPGKVTVWEVLALMETPLVEPTESTVDKNAPDIETALMTRVFEPLDAAIQTFLSGVTIQDLLDESEKQRAAQAFMPNI